jgi:hypothetical protein
LKFALRFTTWIPLVFLELCNGEGREEEEEETQGSLYSVGELSAAAL